MQKNVNNDGGELIKNGVLVKEISTGDTYWKDVDVMIKNSLSNDSYVIKYFVKSDDPFPVFDLPPNFEYVKVYSLYRTSYNGEVVAQLVADKKISSNLSIIDNNLNNEIIDSTSLFFRLNLGFRIFLLKPFLFVVTSLHLKSICYTIQS